MFVPTHSPNINIVIYIDTDNQSPLLTDDLITKLNKYYDDSRFDLRYRVYLFGNNQISISKWEAKLDLANVKCFSKLVPPIKDAADLSLILTIGDNLTHHKQYNENIVIVSRDQLLINFANLLAEENILNVLLAYDESLSTNQLFKNLDTIQIKTTKHRVNHIETLIESVYVQCINKNNLCSKSKFCDRLNQLGFKKSERKKILKHPLIREYMHSDYTDQSFIRLVK